MKKFLKAIGIAFLIFIITTTPVLAIGNPTSTSIVTSKVFENIYATGDMLFVVEQNIDYASAPTEDASDTFFVGLYAADGTTLLLSRSVNNYEQDVISIYVTPAQVTSLGLVWESSYKIRISGNPALFTLVEGTNMATRTYSPSDWNADGALTSLEMLRIYCIQIAQDLEVALSTTLLVTSTSGNQVLNSAGRIIFLAAVPSLDSPLPGLFQLSSSTPSITPGISTGNLTRAATIAGRLGTPIANAFTGIGTFLGIGQQASGAIWGVLVIIIVASIAYLATGSGAAALVISIFPFGMVSYLGVIPPVIFFTVTLAIIVYAVYVWAT